MGAANIDLDALACKAKSGDMKAKSVLVTIMDREAEKIAYSYSRKVCFGENFVEDYKSEAMYGLLSCLDSYDSEKGSFKSYALEAMRMAIRAFITNSQNIVRYPKHISEKMSKISKSINELERDGVEEPTVEDISENTGLSKRVVKNTLFAKSAMHTYSLDYCYGDGEDDDLTLLDSCRSAHSLEDDVMDREREGLFELEFSKLSERDRLILCSEFGAYGINRMSTANLADWARSACYPRSGINRMSTANLADMYSVSQTTIRNWRESLHARFKRAVGY